MFSIAFLLTAVISFLPEEIRASPLLISPDTPQTRLSFEQQENNGGGSSLQSDLIRTGDASRKKLHGRFIHISDIHPDPWYIFKGRQSTQCHRKKPKKEKEKAGFWGIGNTEDCDSPPTLVNLTMEWLEKEWADKVDFVIWTGDSARHDNDHLLPRHPEEIFDLNRKTTAQMNQIFVHRGIPVVPTMGNNDLYPHNIMYEGPNRVTTEYLSIWKEHIPFPSYQVFHRGAYFSREVIPGHLAVISLNTLYFYDSNKVVDGCPPDTDDPGTLQLEWLEVQLDQFRDRKMQVWIMGHVPPTLGNYYQDCYLTYTQLALRFQDTIVGHLYGHMNVDHFFWLDAHELHHPPGSGDDDNDKKDLSKNLNSTLSSSQKNLARIKGKPRYSLAETLLHDFQSLPPAKKPPKGSDQGRIHLDDYAIVNVGPSVVPAFTPSVRIFTYNITGYGERPPSPPPDDGGGAIDDGGDDGDDNFSVDEILTDEIYFSDSIEPDDDDGKKKKGSKRKHGHDHRRPPGKIDCTRRKNRDKDECVFKKPRHASKDSPSRKNTLWSPLGYTQYYLPDIDAFNSTVSPRYQIEYMTYPLEALVVKEPAQGSYVGVPMESPDWPVPQHFLPKPLRNLSEIPQGLKSEMTPYEMNDLTIPSWIKLARKLGQKRKLFNQFKDFMYLGGEEP